jgi:hypothetical protein
MRFNPITTCAGLFAGAGAAGWTLFEFAMGWHNEHWETGAMTGFIAIIFPFAAIIRALRATKSSLGGHLTMKQSLMTGLSISAISGAVGAVFFYAYYTAINPGFIAAMRARGHEVDVTAQLVAVVSGSFIFDLLISAVAGYFMRTKEVTAI